MLLHIIFLKFHQRKYIPEKVPRSQVAATQHSIAAPGVQQALDLPAQET